MRCIPFSRWTRSQRLTTDLALSVVVAIGAAGCATQRFVQSESMGMRDVALETWL